MHAIVFVAVLAIAQDAAPLTADAVVRRAIAAHGGADRLMHYPVSKIVSRGTLVSAAGRTVAFSDERLVRLPDASRTVLRLDTGLHSTQVTQLIHGDQAVSVVDGKSARIDPALLRDLREGLYVQHLARLVPLLQSNVRLDLLSAESNRPVAGHEVVGMRVTVEGHRDVKLFFDRETGLLVKVERRRTTADGLEHSLEQFFLDHREFDGIVRPTRTSVWQDDTEVLRADVLAYTECKSAPDLPFDEP